MAPRRRAPDPVLDAVDDLLAALEENARAAEQIRRRAEAIRSARARGASYREIVEGEDGPLIVELVTGKLDRLFKAGNRIRRAEAAALHDEGMSMERIAATFGVSRQRVSQLLRAGDPGGRRRM